MAAAAPISIQSQHDGNCASDTIQIIMFFADGYKEYFRAFADYVRSHPDIVVPVGLPRDRYNIFEYIVTSAKRYLRLGDVNVRTRTRRASPLLFPGINSGVKCSKHIGAFLGRANTGNTRYWAYTRPDYDRFTHELFHYSKRLKAPFDLRPEPDICVSDHATLNTVGIQFFTMNMSANAFHTFCLVRHNEIWYIGDNMLGFLLPAANITLDNINRYRIGVTDTQNLDRISYTRKFVWYNILENSVISTIAEINRARSEHIGIYDEPYLENVNTDNTVRGRLYYNFGPICRGAPASPAGPVAAMGGAGGPAGFAAPAAGGVFAAAAHGAFAPAAHGAFAPAAPAAGGVFAAAARGAFGAAPAAARGLMNLNGGRYRKHHSKRHRYTKKRQTNKRRK